MIALGVALHDALEAAHAILDDPRRSKGDKKAAQEAIGHITRALEALDRE
jgi:hypothetical protein